MAFIVELRAPPKPIANISMPWLLTVVACAIAAASPPRTVCSPSVRSMIILRGEFSAFGRALAASRNPSEIAVSPPAGPYLLIAASMAVAELLGLSRTRDCALKSTTVTVDPAPLKSICATTWRANARNPDSSPRMDPLRSSTKARSIWIEH